MRKNLSNFAIQVALNKVMGTNLVIDGKIGEKTLLVLSGFQDKFNIKKTSDLKYTISKLVQEYCKLENINEND